MKNIFILLFLLTITREGFSACTTISRTNADPNSILTSSKYNTDLNTVYNAVNSIDGECIQDGTIQTSALADEVYTAASASEIIDSGQSGCTISKFDDDTIQVDKCRVPVNGAVVETSATSSVTWLCTDCSSEAASTSYYVYAKDDSEGSTLNLLISTTAPDSKGLSGNNRVLGKFFNDEASDIATETSQFWINDFNKSLNEIWLRRHGGYGTTNNKIQRYDIIKNWVGNIGYNYSNSKDGAAITINEDGTYYIQYCASFSSAGFGGVTKNSNQLTTSIRTIQDTAQSTYLFMSSVVSANFASCGSWVGYLENGDVIRPHTDGTGSGASEENYNQMVVRRLF